MSFLKVSNLGSWAPFTLKVECGAVSPLFSAFSVTCPQLYTDHIKWKIPEAISKLLLLLVFFYKQDSFFKILFNFISCVLVSGPRMDVTNSCELPSVY